MTIHNKINIKSNIHRKDILKSKVIKDKYKGFANPSVMNTPYFEKPNDVCEMVLLKTRSELNLINNFRKKRESLRFK